MLIKRNPLYFDQTYQYIIKYMPNIDDSRLRLAYTLTIGNNLHVHLQVNTILHYIHVHVWTPIVWLYFVTKHKLSHFSLPRWRILPGLPVFFSHFNWIYIAMHDIIDCFRLFQMEELFLVFLLFFIPLTLVLLRLCCNRCHPKECRGKKTRMVQPTGSQHQPPRYNAAAQSAHALSGKSNFCNLSYLLFKYYSLR